MNVVEQEVWAELRRAAIEESEREPVLSGHLYDLVIRHPGYPEALAYLIGAGAEILGNIEVGEGSKVAAGSVVLTPVPPHTTVAGVPAKPVGKPLAEVPAFDMKQDLE